MKIFIIFIILIVIICFNIDEILARGRGGGGGYRGGSSRGGGSRWWGSSSKGSSSRSGSRSSSRSTYRSSRVTVRIKINRYNSWAKTNKYPLTSRYKGGTYYRTKTGITTGQIYIVPHYYHHINIYDESHYSRFEICMNADRIRTNDNTTTPWFVCPLTRDYSYRYCCGEDFAEYCCRYFDRPSHLGGLIFGVITVIVIGCFFGFILRKSIATCLCNTGECISSGICFVVKCKCFRHKKKKPQEPTTYQDEINLERLNSNSSSDDTINLEQKKFETEIDPPYPINDDTINLEHQKFETKIDPPYPINDNMPPPPSYESAVKI